MMDLHILSDPVIYFWKCPKKGFKNNNNNKTFLTNLAWWSIGPNKELGLERFLQEQRLETTKLKGGEKNTRCQDFRTFPLSRSQVTVKYNGRLLVCTVGSLVSCLSLGLVIWVLWITSFLLWALWPNLHLNPCSWTFPLSYSCLFYSPSYSFSTSLYTFSLSFCSFHSCDLPGYSSSWPFLLLVLLVILSWARRPEHTSVLQWIFFPT